MRKTSKRRNFPKENITIEASTGNVFADLGLSNPEERLAKAKLAMRISKVIDERGLTQVEAAEVLKINQPKISDLLRGRLKGFSTERLFRFLNLLGQDVNIVICEKPARRPHAHVSVAVQHI
jgi:predicted XRE-type DNA-binding protein